MNRVQQEELGSNCSQSDHSHPKLSVKGTRVSQQKYKDLFGNPAG